MLVCSWNLHALEQPSLTTGQTVYVPVYSSLSHGNVNPEGKPEQILLSSMLSVRNTDMGRAMTILSVKYHDSSGRLLRDYLTAPLRLAPIGSKEFFVENQEDKGGAGANFIVEWQAAQPINQPLMESVQVYHWGTQAQAFTSRGQVVHSRAGEP
ncbi:MAG: DUF3124 domain-containing protein [Magnetococcales bacterium]|nr:DUF3124 domain-containing protein [Magnetococcales bacterium]